MTNSDSEEEYIKQNQEEFLKDFDDPKIRLEVPFSYEDGFDFIKKVNLNPLNMTEKDTPNLFKAWRKWVKDFIPKMLYKLQLKEKVLTIEFKNHENEIISSLLLTKDAYNEFCKQGKYCDFMLKTIKQIIISQPFSKEIINRVYDKEEGAIQFLRSYYNQPCKTNVLSTHKTLKFIDPEFYQYITEKLDICTTEEMEKLIND